ncbi:methyl-accepting chemotaxis protein [Leptolyngbya sp. FACHB-261]|uniref:methyl-accepting chemotaxis protein n=1 Tax=Leptolyngbya sp. FACHB-261 TaxID=2692806 RepID=UPI001688CA4D|nr:methyl-accepting chemotaxis protein [Leptolyngbya sp. FACHB-261]MBD2104025.1 HAMP domain-containing protein [Leptolyngbya sp. FACHB-261]
MYTSQRLEDGVRALRAGRYEEAIQLLEEGLKDDPSNLDLRYWLSKAHQQGQRDLDTAVELDQEYLTAQDWPERNGQNGKLVRRAEAYRSEAEDSFVDVSTTTNVDDQQSYERSGKNLNKSQSESNAKDKKTTVRPWDKLSLRTKATVLAVALGTVPVLGVGATAYYFTSQRITNNLISQQQVRATSISSTLSRLTQERYQDTIGLSTRTFLTDPNGRAATSDQVKVTSFKQYLEKGYDLAGFADLNGRVLIKAGDGLDDVSERDWFKAVSSTQRPVIIPPRKSSVTGEYSMFVGAPVVDGTTGKMIGVAYTRTPASYFNEVFAKEAKAISDNVKDFGSQKYLAINDLGNVFIAPEKNYYDKTVQEVFARAAVQLKTVNKVGSVQDTNRLDKQEYVVSYIPLPGGDGLPELNWGALVAQPTAELFAARQGLLFTFAIGIGVASLLVGVIAAYLANRATQPIVAAAGAVEKLGQGKLDTRIGVSGEDELAVLGSNINRMAVQLQSLLSQTQQQARMQKAEREKLQRQVDAIALAVNSIAQGKLDTRIPALTGEGVVKELADQINGMTAQLQELVDGQIELAAQRKAEADALTEQVLKLLGEIKGAARGDLTVRAEVTEGAMGSVADSFNFLVSSLRRVVNGIQEVATQVTSTTGDSISATQELATQAQTQAVQIQGTLSQLEQMIHSIRDVAEAARMAEQVAQKAALTAEDGGQAVDKTVEGVNELRDTIAQTTKMIKRLGEDSQKIESIVSVISKIASQTNLLALNATIEAARAGEQGEGFAVVAEEVRKLAERSAEATEEIDAIVRLIQEGTAQVVIAMEEGTQEVVQGTQLAAQAKERLVSIIEVSREINHLVVNISQAAQQQASVADVIAGTVQQMSQAAGETSKSAESVTDTLGSLNEVVDQLQNSVQNFRTT